jgi:hypothetical protein
MPQFEHFADEINNSAPMLWYMLFAIGDDMDMTSSSWGDRLDPTQGVEYFSYLLDFEGQALYDEVYFIWSEAVNHWDLIETWDEEKEARLWGM